LDEFVSDYKQRMKDVKEDARNLRTRLNLIEGEQFVQKKPWRQKGKEAEE
jgi:ElaB/YqjD/DUF883 family membrane-anchored ribosome-binding protein